MESRMDRPGRVNGNGTALVAKWTCWITGAVFVILALIGFFTVEPAILGVIEGSVALYWLYLLSGIILLWMGFLAEATARGTLWVFAVIYAILTVLGFMAVPEYVRMFEVNVAAHWLHLIMTLVFVIGAGVSQAQGRGERYTVHPHPR